jgi:hypothetical protein
MRMKSVLTHSAQALAEGSLIALLVVGLMAGTVFAAPGGGKGKPGGGGSGGSLAVVVVTDLNGNGAPNWSDQVRFDVSTSNAYPVVSLTCSQGGVLVYSDSRPYYWPNLWDDPGVFTLSSLAWSSGAADCRADLKGSAKRGMVTLGSTSFTAGA